ncbi:MAG: EthD domain-containing protein [Acidobacteriota bacterium]
MVKLVQCVRRKQGMTLQDFRAAWSLYAEHVKEMAAALEASRCATATALAIRENLELVLQRGTAPPFDGLVEIWVDNAPRLEEALEREEVRARIRALWREQETFMDLPESCFFLAAEDEVFEPPTPARP